MFRMLKFIATLCVGAVLGFHLNGLLVRGECNAAGGELSGVTCFVTQAGQ